MYWLFLPPATKFGQGYIFTGVCDSVHWRGRGSASMHDGIPHPPDQVPPPGPGRHPLDQAGTPQDQAGTSPGPGPLWDQAVNPQTRQAPSPHLSRAYWEIRSMCGRYASYWNGILLLLSSSSSAFYPAPQMPKDSKRDFSVLGKMASLFYPLPENAKFYTFSTCNQAFLHKGLFCERRITMLIEILKKKNTNRK